MEEEIQNDDAYTNDADDLPVVTIMDETGAASTSITATSPMLMHASAMVEDDIPKPKKPRNSFFYFRRDYHKTSNAAGNRTRAKNISGAAGKIWKEMSDEKKAPYKELAAEDTKRYKQEMIDYKENLRVLKRQTRIREKDTAGGPSVYGSLPRSPLMGNSQIGPANNQARRHNGTVVDNMLSIHPSIPDIEIIDASNSISLQKYSVKQRK
ncbi:hypothetical protein FBU59_002877 [Linderina macrospora]|uniref:Uncharacterized protein n=1 Tax=Linderina macrospora TaxID=4868 RepID=A0ACC1JA41_9FUNG|nr:hypothetical protein FBU59_002877 [Linderina macrospora]